jgi:PLP dependent protein
MSLHENLDHVGQKIVAAARAAGRDPTAITLVAVSKTVPVERVQEAVRAGHNLFGENYAQELRDKARLVQGARWHFVGPLQRNKVKYVVGVAELIHSVDSPSLLDEIAARADKLGVVQRCLVQVNVGGEAQKSGCAIAYVPALVRAFAARPQVRCEGLMCIPPDGVPPRPFFENLAQLAAAEGLRELSMGMSSDFAEAIAAGATIVRVGTAIFGERPKQ